MTLIHAVLVSLVLSGSPATDSAVVARRVAASAQLAAQEYRIGVVGGKVVAAAEVDPTGRTLRYGLSDESGKLNLNALMKANMIDDQRQAALMALPLMTLEIADAILDFLDAGGNS